MNKTVKLPKGDVECGYEVIVDPETDLYTVEHWAQTGETSYEGVQTVNPNMDTTQESLQKDIEDFQLRLAKDTLARETIRMLLLKVK